MSDNPAHHDDAVLAEMNEPDQAAGTCPVVHDALPYPSAGDPNREWWPESLNLKILAKNGRVRELELDAKTGATLKLEDD